HPTPEVGLETLERRPAPVTWGNHRHRERPLDRQARIVVQEAALRLGVVRSAHLVRNLSPILKNLVAVSETLRNVQRAPVFVVETDGVALEEGRRLRAEVDDDVEDRAARAADELHLRVRRELKMHASDRSGNCVPRDARVDDIRDETSLL